MNLPHLQSLSRHEIPTFTRFGYNTCETDSSAGVGKRPWQDSNLPSLVPKTNAFFSRPQGQVSVACILVAASIVMPRGRSTMRLSRLVLLSSLTDEIQTQCRNPGLSGGPSYLQSDALQAELSRFLQCRMGFLSTDSTCSNGGAHARPEHSSGGFVNLARSDIQRRTSNAKNRAPVV